MCIRDRYIKDRHLGEQKLLEMATFLYAGRFDAYQASYGETSAPPSIITKEIFELCTEERDKDATFR